MNKILDKIKNVPIGVKAAAVYTLASVFSKGLAIITVPIFTRIMSTSEIGVVNLYNSWHSMLNAVVTLDFLMSKHKPFRFVFYYQNKNTKWRYIVKVVFPPLQTVEIGEIIGGGYTSRTL